MARVQKDIAPEDIFLDSSNLPAHDLALEANVERPVSQRALLILGVLFVSAIGIFFSRSYTLQVTQGTALAAVSLENSIDGSLIFATRGVIYDRIGREIAWNAIENGTTTTPYALRHYADLPGLAHLLGWIRYPKQDTSGAWWRESYTPMAGVEASFDDFLRGTNGTVMVERDARGRVQRENIVSPAVNGTDLTLSIDAEMQSTLHTMLARHAQLHGFIGGAAVIMDVQTGELLALTSFPEYDHTAFTEGDASVVAREYADERAPVLDRAVSGLFAPGSIVKPLFAVGALNEKVIAPEKEIVSVGAITIPNLYDPDKPTVFRDWTVHGPVDMRTAIAVSSDEYFYTVGGGYGSQEGLGIGRIDEYARRFGLATKTGISLPGEKEGVIPTPEWKIEVFGADDPWRIGNTYHTAIGQFGFLVTPIQAVRFTAALANGGFLLTPQLLASSTPERVSIGIPDEYLEVARDGMRMAVTSERRDATVKSLNIPGIRIAAKTGTAELGNRNQWMNSWSVGFWPAEEPRYAYAVVLEKAPAGTLSGASPALRPFFEWLLVHRPEYGTMPAHDTHSSL